MILKCEVCGGQIDEVDENLMGKCPYCKTVNIISKNKEKIENWFNRATFLRQHNEYKKATEIYEEILKEDNNDAAAHWGLLLCNYGIEFVYDERTGKTTATCHKLQNHSILNDPDYEMAVKNANIEQQRVFETEAKEINNIYERLIAISNDVKPFDIFISYKDSDDSGDRTQDSVEAQKIYDALTEEGYNVFFARKTLENYLGKEYEPVIFSALQSSKVMILVASSERNINAPWVKNEWGRFLECMEEDKEKTIIPCYFEMSPYEIPLEIPKVQAQDLKKIGFLQDLIDGINKLINKKDTEPISGSATDGPEYLYNKALTYKKLDDEEAARKTFSKMTNDFPGDYRGWWGLAECKSEGFTSGFNNFNNIEFQVERALKLCDDKKRLELEKQWKPFHDKYYSEKYENKLDTLLKKKGSLEQQISSLTDTVNRFTDYGASRSQTYNEVKDIDDGITLVLGDKTEQEEKAETKKKIDRVFIGLTIANIAFWLLIIIASKGIGEGIFSAIVIELLIWGCITIINKVLDKNIETNHIKRRSQAEQMKSELQQKIDQLGGIDMQIKNQNDVKQQLESTKKELEDTNGEIAELTLEGKRVFELSK